jgi:hypothetical protein
VKAPIQKGGEINVAWNRNYVGYGGGSRLVDGVGNEERQTERIKTSFY